MPFYTDGLVYFAPPKTGSAFVRTALNELGLRSAVYQGEHTPPHPGMPSRLYDGRVKFVTVRHPLAWYRSIYCYAISHATFVFPELSRFIEGPICEQYFIQFLEFAAKEYPAFLGTIMRLYLPKTWEGDTVIGYCEDLGYHLGKALDKSSDDYDRDALSRIEPTNCNDATKKVPLSSEASWIVAESESEMMERFGYDSADPHRIKSPRL